MEINVIQAANRFIACIQFPNAVTYTREFNALPSYELILATWKEQRNTWEKQC